MAINLNRKALAHIRSLIHAGKVNADAAWSFDDAADGNALLGKNGSDWGAYAEVHLGVDGDASDHTKARYKYPVVKGGKVYVSALRAAITRAAQNGADDVEAAARKLLILAKGGEHAGFEDWIEVFQAGKHTDSAGNARTWSREDLDQIIANHNAEQPAPLVIGHPKTDSPAWGWTESLKRVGGKLLAKFNQVPEQLVNAVREGRYRNRSVKLAHGDGGWKLIHVGLLGAAPPAVDGLAPIAFEAEPQGVTYQFDALDAAGLNLIARGMQKLRELIIAHFGQDEADTYVPQDDIDNLNSLAGAQRAQTDDDDAPDSPQPAFSRHTEDSAMDEKLKADLDAATARAAEAEQKLAAFAAEQRAATAKAAVDAALAEGRLTPAQAQGLPEFMAALDDTAEFEFAAADGKGKQTGAKFFAEFLAKLPKQIELNRKTAGADAEIDAGDASAIVKAAQEFQKAEGAKGVTVPWHEAVTHVTQKAH
jgi:hypothetical protein